MIRVLSSWFGGSSPLTRGAQIIRAIMNFGDRLIPAHAGSTRKRLGLPLQKAAHPRSRGEHLFPVDHFNPVAGSSPLTRGAPPSTSSCARAMRLIPAHAGSTA